MSDTYKTLVSSQIQKIIDSITLDEKGNLRDSTATPTQITDAIGEFNVKLDANLEKDFNEVLLCNWIYCNYYQNRDKNVGDSGKINERHFPFKQMSRGGENAHWRSRFWRYDGPTDTKDRPILTRGYETIYAKPQQFIEDDIVFETLTIDEETKFAEVPYLSMIFPKFEISENQKFAFGKYPLDDDGQGGVIRFYFHLDTNCLSLSIPQILTKVTSLFNSRLIPFQIKFQTKAADFVRADHFILYVERRHFFVAGILLNHVYKEIKTFLDDKRAPLFVREAKPGIGVAKDPERDFVSFGFSRSTAIAKAILKKFEDPALRPAFEYLEHAWGGIENFFLDPKPRFSYQFDIFSNEDSLLHNDVQVDKFLSAAWYLARLLCREAVWIEHGRCNWLSYRLMGESLGYRLLDADNGIEGLESVIIFLQAFKSIGIRDAVLEHVLAGAEASFAGRNGQKVITQGPKSAGALLAAPGIKKIVVLPEGFMTAELRKELEEAIMSEQPPQASKLPLLLCIVTDHIENERPVSNRLDGSDHFCANMRHGIAGYGYACLRLYDPILIPSLSGVQF